MLDQFSGAGQIHIIQPAVFSVSHLIMFVHAIIDSYFLQLIPNFANVEESMRSVR